MIPGIWNCKLCDFIVTNSRGDYWHNPTSGMCQSNKIIKDEQRKLRLQELGYRVEMFWESELTKTPKIAFIRLKSIIESLQYENKINNAN